MDSKEMARFEEAKAFIQSFLSSITELPLAQLKVFLKNIEKKLSTKDYAEGNPLDQYSSVTEIIDHTTQAKGKGALHFACARGDVELVRYLIEEYKADFHIKDSEKNTPFLTAVQHGHLSLVAYFVEELSCPVDSSTDGNVTALHIAANNNSSEMIEYLLGKGADIEKVSIYGKPLNWAVGSNQTLAALLLLQKGADPNGDTAAPFPSPLILAVDFGNTELYGKLIEKGANLETKDPKGYSLLQLAAEKGNLELVKFLIGRGLDLNYQAEGKSSYFLAFQNEKFEVVEYLKSILNRDSYEAIEKLVSALKQKKQESTLSKEQIEYQSTELKNLGNKCYTEKKYEEAIKHYSKAIEIDPANNILYSNRAASYLALKNYQKTLEDCQMGKKINPNHIKTVVREAQAYLGLNNYLEASVSFWEALKLEPHNHEILAEFTKCSQIAKQQHQNSQGQAQ